MHLTTHTTKGGLFISIYYSRTDFGVKSFFLLTTHAYLLASVFPNLKSLEGNVTLSFKAFTYYLVNAGSFIVPFFARLTCQDNAFSKS